MPRISHENGICLFPLWSIVKLHVNDQLVTNCKDSRRPCLKFVSCMTMKILN